MSRSSKSLKNIFTAIVGQSFGILISFIARIFFIRILGSEYLGLNGLFTNILTVLSLAELGVGEAITFSLYKPLAQNDIKECKSLMQFYQRVYRIVGLFILIVGISITPFLKYLINDLPNIKNLNLIYILFVINTAISYFFSYKRNLIIADQKRYIATIYRYSFYFFLNLFQIILLIIYRNYILFLMLQIFFTFLDNYFVSKKADKLYPYLKEKDSIPLNEETKRTIIRNTKAMLMSKIGGVVVNSTDNILLSKFVGLVYVGLYSNYYLITSALNTIYSQFFNSLVASVGNLCVDEDNDKMYVVFKNIYFVNFWIYCFTVVSLFALFNPFIELWLGEDYLFELDIVIIIIINFYIYGMRKTILMFRDATGLFYKDRWKSIVESIINLVVSILLALKLGTFGVFLGTFISSLATCVWFEPYILYKYVFKKKLREFFKIYLRYNLITISLCFLTYLLCSIVCGPKLLAFIIKMIICLILPNSVILLLFKNNSEFKYIKNIFVKIFNKIKKVVKKVNLVR